MKLKIISNGTLRGTKVINAETGEPSRNIVGIQWRVDVKGEPQARVILNDCDIEVEGEFTQELEETKYEGRGLPCFDANGKVMFFAKSVKRHMLAQGAKNPEAWASEKKAVPRG